MKTYDVVFHDNDGSNSKGWEISAKECRDYISAYNGTNHSYFEDYKGGIARHQAARTDTRVRTINNN